MCRTDRGRLVAAKAASLIGIIALGRDVPRLSGASFIPGGGGLTLIRASQAIQPGTKPRFQVCARVPIRRRPVNAGRRQIFFSETVS
jgi:hypothetical protein